MGASLKESEGLAGRHTLCNPIIINNVISAYISRCTVTCINDVRSLLSYGRSMSKTSRRTSAYIRLYKGTHPDGEMSSCLSRQFNFL